MYNPKHITMAKIYGLFGSMTGKVADVVMSVRNGEQIVRKYQPTVANPSSPAQVEARAKLKLMSQLSAIMAPVIAIPRAGSVTPRNMFVKSNYYLTGYSSNTATINLNEVQLTKSVVAMPALSTSRDETKITVGLASEERNVPLNVNRVVYSMFEKQTDESLRFLTSVTVTEAGEDGSWGATLPLTPRSVVIYAYGVRDNTDAARTIFGNLESPTAEQVANLVVSRTLTESDITLTETRGITLAEAV